MRPYYDGGDVLLYHGDCRDLLPALGVTADLAVADPPYEETPHRWDRWPDGWPAAVAAATASLWCFLPVRQFAAPPWRGREFADAGWKLSHDIVWEKHNGSGFTRDRFRRVHEPLTHWYRGRWSQVHHKAPQVPGEARPNATIGRRATVGNTAPIKAGGYAYGPTRLARSVLRIRSAHHRAVHPTQKPAELLRLLIDYGCPPGGLVLDPMAGSGSAGLAARLTGRRAVLIEADEQHCETAARQLTHVLL